MQDRLDARLDAALRQLIEQTMFQFSIDSKAARGELARVLAEEHLRTAIIVRVQINRQEDL